MKTVLVLVGPKGSGKTHIGALLQRRTGTRFLRVEPLFLEAMQELPGAGAEARGFKRVEAAVEAEEADTVALESTGASGHFEAMLGRLRSRHRVLLVAVRAPAETCLERVRTRDSKDHVAVSDHHVEEINRRAAQVSLAWDLVIDNGGPAPEDSIAEALRELLDRPSMPGFPVAIRLPVQWGDMDALGHVNNARYFTWFEGARIMLFRRVGLLSEQGGTLGPILARTACDFLKPVHYPLDIVVGARVTRIGNTSFNIEYAVAPAATPTDPCARGDSVVVLVDYTTSRKVPVPAELRATIERLFLAPQSP